MKITIYDYSVLIHFNPKWQVNVPILKNKEKI